MRIRICEWWNRWECWVMHWPIYYVAISCYSTRWWLCPMIGRYFGWLEMNSWMANRWLKEDDCFVCLGVWCAGLSHPFRVFASFFRLWVAPCAVMNLFIISREINIVIFIFPRWLYTIYIYNRYRVTHHSRKRWTISIHSGCATFFTCFTRLSNARSR